ncbi:MAG: hypothetical protein LBQ81_09805 [Zoogloeaceae bacterium]|jgi:hypothetical protein|nr:hypothetical protein [Zoogloeaceae bacterium]
MLKATIETGQQRAERERRESSAFGWCVIGFFIAFFICVGAFGWDVEHIKNTIITGIAFVVIAPILLVAPFAVLVLILSPFLRR